MGTPARPPSALLSTCQAKPSPDGHGVHLVRRTVELEGREAAFVANLARLQRNRVHVPARITRRPHPPARPLAGGSHEAR